MLQHPVLSHTHPLVQGEFRKPKTPATITPVHGGTYMVRASCSELAFDSRSMSLTLSVTNTLSSVTRNHWYRAAAQDNLGAQSWQGQGGGGQGQRWGKGCLSFQAWWLVSS